MQVFVDIGPLLMRAANPEENSDLSIDGWFPIYDTLKGIRGELHVALKIRFIGDVNPFRKSSAGVQFFATSELDEKQYCVTSVLGFVEELAVAYDPEFGWRETLRTARFSNDARHALLFKLGATVRRRIGVKVQDAGGNAVLAYVLDFDIEGDSGIVARASGTACVVYPIQKYMDDHQKELLTDLFHEGVIKEMRVMMNKQRSSPRRTSNLYPISWVMSCPNVLNKCKSVKLKQTGREICLRSTKVSKVDFESVTLLTMTVFPPSAKLRLGGLVMARSVKYLGKLATSLSDQDTRDYWWSELRSEVRGHAQALACTHVVGYSECATIYDDVCIMSATGTAVTLRRLCSNPTAVYERPMFPITGNSTDDHSTIEKEDGNYNMAFELDSIQDLFQDKGTTSQQCYIKIAGNKLHHQPEVSPAYKPFDPMTRSIRSKNLAVTELPVPQQRNAASLTLPQRRKSGSLTPCHRRSHSWCGSGGISEGKRRFNLKSNHINTEPYSPPPVSLGRLYWKRCKPVRPCSYFHTPYNRKNAPFSGMLLVPCGICGRKWVPQTILSTIEPPKGITTRGNGMLVEAKVCRVVRRAGGGASTGDAHVVSESLPFIEFDLQRQLMLRLKVMCANAVFSLRCHLAVGPSLVVGTMSGTAFYVEALPPPPMLISSPVEIGCDEDVQALKDAVIKLSTINRRKIVSLKPNRVKKRRSTRRSPTNHSAKKTGFGFDTVKDKEGSDLPMHRKSHIPENSNIIASSDGESSSSSSCSSSSSSNSCSSSDSDGDHSDGQAATDSDEDSDGDHSDGQAATDSDEEYSDDDNSRRALIRRRRRHYADGKRVFLLDVDDETDADMLMSLLEKHPPPGIQYIGGFTNPNVTKELANAQFIVAVQRAKWNGNSTFLSHSLCSLFSDLRANIVFKLQNCVPCAIYGVRAQVTLTADNMIELFMPIVAVLKPAPDINGIKDIIAAWCPCIPKAESSDANSNAIRDVSGGHPSFELQHTLPLSLSKSMIKKMALLSAIKSKTSEERGSSQKTGEKEVVEVNRNSVRQEERLKAVNSSSGIELSDLSSESTQREISGMPSPPSTPASMYCPSPTSVLERFSFSFTANRHKETPAEDVELTPLSYIPGAQISRYLGIIVLHFIKECNVRRGNHKRFEGSFTHLFTLEVNAVVRAHVAALGGNAMLCYSLKPQESGGKVYNNQVYNMLCVSGDVVCVTYDTDVELLELEHDARVRTRARGGLGQSVDWGCHLK